MLATIRLNAMEVPDLSMWAKRSSHFGGSFQRGGARRTSEVHRHRPSRQGQRPGQWSSKEYDALANWRGDQSASVKAVTSRSSDATGVTQKTDQHLSAGLLEFGSGVRVVAFRIFAARSPIVYQRLSGLPAHCS
jgi:hypothetical protein